MCITICNLCYNLLLHHSIITYPDLPTYMQTFTHGHFFFYILKSGKVVDLVINALLAQSVLFITQGLKTHVVQLR